MNPSPSQMRWTGLFLASGLALVVVAVVYLVGSSMFRKRLPLVCILRGESVSGLSAGGKVQLRGIEVGNIVSLRFDPADPENILVAIEVNPGAPVYKNATATLEIFGITGLKYLDLVPGDPARGLATPGSILPIQPSRTMALINTLDTVAHTSARVLDNLDRLTGKNRQVQIDSIVRDLRNTSRDFAAMSGTLRDMHLETQVSQVVGHVQNAVRKIDSTISVLEPARSMARIDTAASALSSVARRADLMLGRSQSDIYRGLEDMSTTMRNLSDFSQTIRDNPTTLLRAGERGAK